MALRDLTILSKLSSKATSIFALDMSLSDMLGVRALYHLFRLKASATSLSLILAILSGFLSPLSATLFTSQAIPGTHDVLVKQTSWFGPAPPSDDWIQSSAFSQMELSLRSMLLNNQVNNFIYPEFTYGDLVFPSVEIDGSQTFWSPENSIKVNVTAAKLVSDCSRLLPGDYNLTVVKNQYDLKATIEIKSHYQYGQNISEPQKNFSFIANLGNDITSYFAHNLAARSPFSLDMQLHIGPGPHWADTIDSGHPPVPDSSKLKPYEPPLVIYNDFLENFGSTLYSLIVGFKRIGHIFPAIFEPWGSFRLESVADPGQDLKLIEAAKFKFDILAAQMVSIQNRYSINESFGSAFFPTLKGIIVDNNRPRLVQNFPVTVTMIVILSLVLAFHTWSLISAALWKALGSGRKWLLDLELKGLAPSGFGSIAMMNALLYGSNIREKLPRGAEFMSAKDTSMSFENVECRLGWFYNTRTEQQQYTVGIVERGEFEFINREKR
ncbi:unnamed protein product [Clonostachys rhizophaga]|uniref:Uncharacterized protein n=1 Tax=Clonostachys rhizophaga TaxID=160324 RepID=A0A9N9W0D7_9HYPO|nr:unnamed protein product [Clonostachys rhizophaga]